MNNEMACKKKKLKIKREFESGKNEIFKEMCLACVMMMIIPASAAMIK